jgi:hypothetical protein
LEGEGDDWEEVVAVVEVGQTGEDGGHLRDEEVGFHQYL